MADFQLLESYKSDLQNYTLEQLHYIPAEGVWSIGQMYDHLIIVAHEYLDNVEKCSVLKYERPLGKTEFGEKLYQAGGFPPIKIRLPDEMNEPPNNTDTMEELINRMEEVIQRMRHWEAKVQAIHPNKKVEHGGFGWLNAKEWYDLVSFHFRHHLRQKRELEEKVGEWQHEK